MVATVVLAANAPVPPMTVTVEPTVRLAVLAQVTVVLLLLALERYK